jgi:hypothetical protein
MLASQVVPVILGSRSPFAAPKVPLVPVNAPQTVLGVSLANTHSCQEPWLGGGGGKEQRT